MHRRPVFVDFLPLHTPRWIPLALAAVVLVATGCGEPDQVVQPTPPSGSPTAWVRPDRSIGEIHNSILGRTFHRLDATTASAAERDEAFRAAVLEQVAEDTQGDPAATEEVRSFLDGPRYREVQRRFEEASTLVHTGHPGPAEITRMLEGWGIEPDEAARIADLYSHALLGQSTSLPRPKSEIDESERIFRDVYSHSREYWSRRARYRVMAAPEEVIGADALGALGGLAFGAIGSIIGGAAYSIFWEVTEPEPVTGGCGSCH